MRNEKFGISFQSQCCDHSAKRPAGIASQQYNHFALSRLRLFPLSFSQFLLDGCAESVHLQEETQEKSSCWLIIAYSETAFY